MPSVPQDSITEAEQHASDLFDGVIHLKNRAKEKAKQLLDATGPSYPDDHVSDDETDIFTDAAFDPSKIQQKTSPKSKNSTHETLSDGAKGLKYLLCHPKRVMRGQATRMAAEKLGNARHPTLTIDRDQELLDAHDSLARAASHVSLVSDVDKFTADVDDAHARVHALEDQRDSLQTAWVLSRHVCRVKVVRPIPRPDRSQFMTVTDGEARLQWDRYLGHLLLYYTQEFTAPYIDEFESPPFDLEDVARIIERLAIISAPWQSFLINVRNVYMWTDPKKTARWLALYCVLWYTEHMMGFLYFYIIYSTIRNHLQPRSVQSIRESVARSVDRGAHVQAWGELIQKHGKHDWLEPLLDELGPMIQLQLGDLVGLLEVMANFHRFERPRMTTATLFLFACCLLVTVLGDMAFCMKLFWLVCGVVFFCGYPIATRWPQYRLLVSPFRWMFWDIPTHAELAIQHLQEKALLRDADLAEFELPQPHESTEPASTEQDQDQDPDLDPEEELVDDTRRLSRSRFFNVFDKVHGKARLVVSRTGITVHTKGALARSWRFDELSEIRKLDDVDTDSTTKNLRHVHSRSAEVLQFLFLSDSDGTDKDSTLTVVLQTADRDRVFNLVLAWSGLKWQALMLERLEKKNEKTVRSNLDRSIKRVFY
ncbi:hypothetical protein A1O3_00658 [Capronia epimyces CBS 606.96]|uniref:GRAM domain-containing protein n=1 Tax=Capronia epimyces CBS 606.96 TaxID=1182542 RepID=W9YHS9_9EURO|nr:uncharacterized protein A1O3_00658 [Capronia epimyces CBS 606.96]EXJ92108.1 hypothetical protein A1O3_00658 [Capronia epimyces CBS 606.96]